MFFVAFLLESEKNVVIPIEWIYENVKQWEKYVNSGLNSNQIHRIYFENEDPENEPGDANFTLDLDAQWFPDRGCYSAKLVKFFSG